MQDTTSQDFNEHLCNIHTCTAKGAIIFHRAMKRRQRAQACRQTGRWNGMILENLLNATFLK